MGVETAVTNLEQTSQESQKLRVLCVVWASTPEYVKYKLALKESILAQRKKGIVYKLEVLVIDGFSNFQSEEQELQSLGCRIFDKSDIFNDLVCKYKKIYDKYKSLSIYGIEGEFFFRNLIRWLVCCDHAVEGDFLHVDADLVMNQHPNKLLEDFESRSFYASSTCFIYINDSIVFKKSYETDLSNLNSDPDGYVRFIADTARLRQTNLYNMQSLRSLADLDEEAFFCFHVQQNPLHWRWPTNAKHIYIPFMTHTYGPHNGVGGKHTSTPIEYTYKDCVHFWNGLPLAYMHYQTRFTELLGYRRAQSAMGIVPELQQCLRPVTMFPDQGNLVPEYFIDRMIKDLSEFSVGNEHPFLYRDILVHQENIGMGDIFCDAFWHAKGSFR